MFEIMFYKNNRIEILDYNKAIFLCREQQNFAFTLFDNVDQPIYIRSNMCKLMSI